jgi:hypothetical protein
MSGNTDYRDTAAELASDLNTLPRAHATEASNEPTDTRKKSQATRLIELAKTVELFHGADGKAYALLEINGQRDLSNSL